MAQCPKYILQKLAGPTHPLEGFVVSVEHPANNITTAAAATSLALFAVTRPNLGVAPRTSPFTDTAEVAFDWTVFITLPCLSYSGRVWFYIHVRTQLSVSSRNRA
jgi:hypothetical protein